MTDLEKKFLSNIRSAHIAQIARLERIKRNMEEVIKWPKVPNRLKELARNTLKDTDKMLQFHFQSVEVLSQMEEDKV